MHFREGKSLNFELETCSGSHKDPNSALGQVEVKRRQFHVMRLFSCDNFVW